MRRLLAIRYSLSAFRTRPLNQLKPMQKAIQSRLELVGRTALNHDSYLFSFRYLGEPLPLTVGKHFVIRQFLKTWEYPDGQQVKRKYTPLSEHLSKEGLMDVLIKIYRPNSHPKFPNGGKLTPFLEQMKLGDTLNIEGPLGRFSYRRGVVKLEGEDEFPVKKIVMFAGGSGITPMYNVISHIVADKEDPTEIVLLFCNRSEEDILLRKQLESMQGRIRLHFMIDAAQPGWTGLVGYVRKEVLQQVSNLEEPNTLYCHSGPFLMNQSLRSIFDEFPGGKLFKF